MSEDVVRAWVALCRADRCLLRRRGLYDRLLPRIEEQPRDAGIALNKRIHDREVAAIQAHVRAAQLLQRAGVHWPGGRA